jgi:hypothetical protein
MSMNFFERPHYFKPYEEKPGSRFHPKMFEISQISSGRMAGKKLLYKSRQRAVRS